jgi:hypothetical protein
LSIQALNAALFAVSAVVTAASAAFKAASSAAQGAMAEEASEVEIDETSREDIDDIVREDIDDIASDDTDEKPMDIMEEELSGGSSARAGEDVERSRAVTIRATARKEREILEVKDMGEGEKKRRIGRLNSRSKRVHHRGSMRMRTHSWRRHYRR